MSGEQLSCPVCVDGMRVFLGYSSSERLLPASLLYKLVPEARCRI